ncbi:MAG TPA: HipA family kinase [Solirubrobacterales bacterium]
MPTGLRTVAASRYVTPFREGGSLPALLEADDYRLYVGKFRGAGQGPLVLVAEVIAGELARALGLPMPELVTIEVDGAIGRGEPDPEIQELLLASVGLNLGVEFLGGAETYSPSQDDPPAPDLAAEIVWFDALVANVDRTPRNANLLVHDGKLNLIDHGASLYHQHGGLDPADQAARPFPQIAEHILLPVAGPIGAADERLRAKVTPDLIRDIVDLVPPDWFVADPPGAYVEYLTLRTAAMDQLTEEAERARLA